MSGGVCVWTNPVSGKWEVDGNWSGILPTNELSIYITNAGTKTVTIDTNTVATAPASLTICDLTLSAPGTDQLTLLLDNAGTNAPLHVLDTCSTL